MFSTPAGMPARSASSATARADSGVASAGLMTTGAARSQRGRDLAGNHGNGEVPRRDGGADADGLLDDQVALVVVGGGDGFAVDALGFFGKPFQKAGSVADFALGFGQGFALLGGHDAGQVVGVGVQQVRTTSSRWRRALWRFCCAMRAKRRWRRPGRLRCRRGRGWPRRASLRPVAGSITSKRLVPGSHWPLTRASVLSRLGSFSRAKGDAVMVGLAEKNRWEWLNAGARRAGRTAFRTAGWHPAARCCRWDRKAG